MSDVTVPIGGQVETVTGDDGFTSKILFRTIKEGDPRHCSLCRKRAEELAGAVGGVDVEPVEEPEEGRK